MNTATFPAGPDLKALRAPALQLAATSGVFVAAYSLCNHLTALRADVGEGVFEFERAIPFVPWTIVPYLSIIGFFVLAFFVGGGKAALERHVSRLMVNLGISIACYALFPLRFMFERPLPEGVCGAFFELLSFCDLPYNRAPSLHISVLLLLWVRLAPRTPASLRPLLHAWFALIGVSVLTTYQHHLIDIPAGLAVGGLSILLTSDWFRNAVRAMRGERLSLRAA